MLTSDFPQRIIGFEKDHMSKEISQTRPQAWTLKHFVLANFLAALAVMLLGKLAFIAYNISGSEGYTNTLEILAKVPLFLGWDIVGAVLYTGFSLLLTIPIWRWASRNAAVTVSAVLLVLLAIFSVVSFFVNLAFGSPINKAIIDLIMLNFDPELQVPGGAFALSDSISHYFSPFNATFMVFCALAAVVILVAFWMRPMWPGRRLRLVALAVLAALTIVTVVLLPRLRDGSILRIRLHTYALERNSLTTLVASYLRPVVREAFSADYEFDDPFCFDFSSMVEPEPPGQNPLYIESADAGPVPESVVPRKTDLVIVLLEAVASNYLRSDPGLMPFLGKLGQRDGGVAFTQHYSPWSQTMKAVFCILCSEMPFPEYPPITFVRPEIPCISLTEVLKDSGYTTAYFLSADFGFDRQLRFFRHRSFDRMEDMYSMPGREGAWANSWGVDESVTIRAVLDWIDEMKGQDRERPVAVIYNMVAGHHPFVYPGGPPPPSSSLKAELEAYLGCLKYIDERIREMVEGLEERGYLDDTLVVVLSDHGEAFNQHGTRGHGNQVYDEFVRVPLVLYGPQLRGVKGGMDFPTGHIDLAPTLLGLLGLPVPLTMKGRNLLVDRSGRAMLFGGRPEDEQYGIRDGKWKLIVTGETGVVELFDLEADPDEKHNVADDRPQLAKDLLRRVREWIPHSRNLIETYPSVLEEHGHRCLPGSMQRKNVVGSMDCDE